MARLSGATAPATGIECDALVLGVTGTGDIAAHESVPDDVRTAMTAAAAPLELSSKVGAVTRLVFDAVAARRVVLVGVGDGADADLREAAGAASRECGKAPSRVVVALPAPTENARVAVGEGLLLGSYRFDRYRTKEDAAERPETEWSVAGASESELARASIVATAVNAARDLVNTPPRDLDPATFASEAARAATDAGLSCRVWDVPDLERDGFGGILAVGLGSSRGPRLVRVAWEPPGATTTVAIVGKGITFDTGGISIKTNDGMQTMKSDMAGAAAALSVAVGAARLKLPVAVTAWLCLAENMPSSTAQRPSDVIAIHGGTTVEVMNTDAEGRLVLADGLDAALGEKPSVALDVATLTGAQGLALGPRTSGVMGTASVRDAVVAASGAVGESMWAMPLPEYLKETLESKVADLRNVSTDAKGGMLTAGLFLKEFVGDTPWAHLDIARPAFNEGGAYGFTPPGGTGVAVRTLLAYLESLAV